MEGGISAPAQCSVHCKNDLVLLTKFCWLKQIWFSWTSELFNSLKLCNQVVDVINDVTYCNYAVLLYSTLLLLLMLPRAILLQAKSSRWAWDIPIGFYMKTSYRFVVAMQTGRVSFHVIFGLSIQYMITCCRVSFWSITDKAICVAAARWSLCLLV